MAEVVSSVVGSAVQQSKPTVTQNLGSPSVSSASQATSSVIHRPWTSQHVKFIGQPEIRVATHPQTRFLRPRSEQAPMLFSLMNSSEATVRKFLPKSNLARMIIRDNLRAQRIYEMEMRTLDKTKRKMSQVYDNMKKKFMTDQLRKLERWRRESMSIQRYLDSIRAHEDGFRLPRNRKSQPP